MKTKLLAAWRYFSTFEKLLWAVSAAGILLSYFLFREESALSLAASLVGSVALIFSAKGNPLGQALFIVFGVLYGIISYSYAYYGEMLTYLGMSVPMAVFSLIAWLRHPSGAGRAEVRVGHLTVRDAVLLPCLAVAVTVLFYFVLREFGTANLLPSTFSVTTSFVAVYFAARRSPWYAFAYAINDLVLILLWSLAALHNTSYLSVVICFAMFLMNDAYSFFNWRRMKRKQEKS